MNELINSQFSIYVSPLNFLSTYFSFHVYREIQAHVSEPFWTMKVLYRSPDGVIPIQRCEFLGRRGRL